MFLTGGVIIQPIGIPSSWRNGKFERIHCMERRQSYFIASIPSFTLHIHTRFRLFVQRLLQSTDGLASYADVLWASHAICNLGKERLRDEPNGRLRSRARMYMNYNLKSKAPVSQLVDRKPSK